MIRYQLVSYEFTKFNRIFFSNKNYSFWNLCDKEKQDFYLASLLHKREEKSTQIKWDHSIKLLDMTEIKVCLKFLNKLFQIEEKRIRNIKQKLITNKPLIEMRGRFEKCKKIDPEIFNEFINSIPKINSHYSSTQSQYFYNQDLTLIKLLNEYKLFLQRKNICSDLCKFTFNEYFKNNFNIKLRQNRTDFCDFCYEKKTKMKDYLTDNSYIEHKNKVKIPYRIEKLL